MWRAVGYWSGYGHIDCGYCGTQQRVERAGGVVALKRVEGAIKAVQRGTDRTAAELALIRLEKEIAEAQVTKTSAIATQQRKDADGRRGRSYLCLFTFVISWFACSALIAAVGFKGEAVGSVGSLLALILTIFVYKKKAPPAETPLNRRRTSQYIDISLNDDEQPSAPKQMISSEYAANVPAIHRKDAARMSMCRAASSGRSPCPMPALFAVGAKDLPFAAQ